MWKPRLREAKGWARSPSQERSVPSPQSELRLRQDTATLPERLKQAAKGAGVGGSGVGSRHPGADWARGAHDPLPNTNQGGQGAGAEGGAGRAEGGASCPGGPPAGWSGRCAAWEFIWGASRGGRHGRGCQDTPSSPAPCCVPWVSHGASDVLSSARPGLQPPEETPRMAPHRRIWTGPAAFIRVEGKAAPGGEGGAVTLPRGSAPPPWASRPAGASGCSSGPASSGRSGPLA